MSLSIRPSQSDNSGPTPAYGERLSLMIQRSDPKLDLVRHKAAEILDTIRRDYAPRNLPELGTIHISAGMDVRLDLSDPIDAFLLAGTWAIHLLVRALILEFTDAQESLELTRNLPVALVRVCRTFMAHHRADSYVFRDLLVARILEAIDIVGEINSAGRPWRPSGVVGWLTSWAVTKTLDRELEETSKAVLSRMLRDVGVHTLDEWETPTDESYCLWLFGRADWLTRGSG
ncbi:hypothetical protein MCOR09_007047 [Pyricularia oryzae]|nr:hypothetical protein MCOR09_007047 [Pyricularia oryzae]